MMVDEPWLARLRIEPLDRRRHDRAAFSCGIDRIDNFLKNPAARHAKADFSKTYVALAPPDSRILGYYALCPHAIDVSTLPEDDRRRMPGYPRIGAIYLSMIGVDRAAQGRGLGTYLLADVFDRCVKAADHIGGHFIVLDALDERAARLYRRVGFHHLPAPGQEQRMLIPMAKVRAAVDAAAAAPP